jgi:antiviral helicase SKI2
LGLRAKKGGDDDDLEGFYGGGGGGGKKGKPAPMPAALLGGGGAGSGGGASAAATNADAPTGTGADRRLWLLVLHAPGPQDPPDARGVGGGEGGAASAAPAAPTASAGHGLLLRAGSGKGGLGGASSSATTPSSIPGPLPRYGECAGVGGGGGGGNNIGSISGGGGGGGSWALVEAKARDLVSICRARLQLSPSELDPRAVLSPDARGLPSALRALARVRDEAAEKGGGAATPEELDPRSDLRVADVDAVRALAERTTVLDHLRSCSCHNCPGTPSQLALVRSRALLARRCKLLERELSDAALAALPEFRQRLELLASLGYVDPSDGTVTIKGRAACEINSVQCELLATEAVFRGLLSGLNPAEVVALFSALVFQEKSDVAPDLASAPALREAARDLSALAREVARSQAACGLPVEEEEYSTMTLHWGLAEAVLEWARGAPFSSVAALTDAPEGSIVRCVVRLDQAMRELQDCARVMGDTRLFAQARAASAAIKRDVIFSASLYVA